MVYNNGAIIFGTRPKPKKRGITSTATKSAVSYTDEPVQPELNPEVIEIDNLNFKDGSGALDKDDLVENPKPSDPKDDLVENPKPDNPKDDLVENPKPSNSEDNLVESLKPDNPKDEVVRTKKKRKYSKKKKTTAIS